MTYQIKTADGREVTLDLSKPLYIANPETGKTSRFMPDNIKLFSDNITVHGYQDMGRFSLPKEYSLKYLNRRIIFTKKKDAENWLAKKGKPKKKPVNTLHAIYPED